MTELIWGQRNMHQQHAVVSSRFYDRPAGKLRKEEYHEMRIQTLHRLECQNCRTSPQADLLLTGKELKVTPATKIQIHEALLKRYL